MLTLDRVSFSYGRRFAVDNISLHLHRGSFAGLIGPNGSGKTTLLRLMSGALRTKQGRVFLEGRLLEQYGARELARHVAVIAAEQYFEFPFPVYDIVAMGRFPYLGRFAELSDADEAIVAEALTLTGTESLRLRPISELSSGERQRVLIARAIAQQPAVLMLDEPNAHLDIHHQLEVFRLLQRLNRERDMTIVVILHDLTAAAAFCQRTVLLHEGKLIADGAPADVITTELIQQIYGSSISVHPSPAGGYPQIAYSADESAGN